MRILLLVLFWLVGMQKMYAQKTPYIIVCVDIELIKKKKSQTAHSEIKFPADLKGVDTSWSPKLEQLLRDSVRINKKAPNGQYVSTIYFKADSNGYFSDIRPSYGGWGFADGAIRQIRRTGKSGWIPAPQNGRAVGSYRTSAVGPEPSTLNTDTPFSKLNRVGARADIEVIKEKRTDTVRCKITLLSTPPGFDTTWVSKLEKQLSAFQPDKKIKRGRYTFSLHFLVDRDGTASDVKCLSNPGYNLCDNEYVQ